VAGPANRAVVVRHRPRLHAPATLTPGLTLILRLQATGTASVTVVHLGIWLALSLAQSSPVICRGGQTRADLPIRESRQHRPHYNGQGALVPPGVRLVPDAAWTATTSP
jgi:hypothetical protein